MIAQWYFEGAGLAVQHHAPGVGWGRIGTFSSPSRQYSRQPVRRGRMGVEYRIGGEWLTTRAIAGDPRNVLGLGRKAVQSRLDRLKRSGYWPETRGASQNMRFEKANFELTWEVIQTEEPKSLRLIRLPIASRRGQTVDIAPRHQESAGNALR